MLLTINLGSVITLFPNNSNPIILQWESGKDSRQLPIFPGLDVPRNWPQGQTVQRSDKLQETQELDMRLHRPHLACWKVKLMTVQLEKDWTIAYMEGIPGGNLISLHSTWQHSSGLQNCIWTNHRHNTWAQTPHTSFFSSHGTWTPGTYWVNHWVTQQDNDPRHNNKSTTGRVKNSKTKAWVSLL